MSTIRLRPGTGRGKVEPNPGFLDDRDRLRPELQILRACCRQRFDDGHARVIRSLCERHAIDWDRLFVAATEHGVAPLVGLNLERLDEPDRIVPRAVRLRFGISCVVNRDAKERAGVALREFLDFCDQHSLPVLLIKGVALDRVVYAAPFPTVSSDVDLVLGVSLEELDATTRTGFYDLIGILGRRTGWGWECEWLEHHDLTLNGLLPICFRTIWEGARPVDHLGHRVHVMGAEDLLIASCIGAYRRRFERLKALCDIRETVMRFPDLRWEDVWQRAKLHGCSGIVHAGLIATGATLGLDQAPPEPPRSDLGACRRRLIRFLFGSACPNGLDRDDARAATRIDFRLLCRLITLRRDQVGPVLARSLRKLVSSVQIRVDRPRSDRPVGVETPATSSTTDHDTEG
ncbi:nucleotidyltransferase family protein [Aquisphaera insulae]|uniref:nucleotidyltransferase family protein n=1 Tax=Aquisphaera insulae TaxID=2712864 RepID=UPI0013EA5F23|nr:nucleotidyltransferase family protein [Aquisphaera insulae]